MLSGRHLQVGIYKACSRVRRHLQEGIYRKTFTGRHLQEGIYRKAFTGRHLQEGISQERRTMEGESNFE
jgi:hypothetical protein